MTISIPDDILREARLTEREALTELACRLFDADRLTKPAAARLAGLARPEFEEQLRQRGLAIVHLDDEHWKQEQRGLEWMARNDPRGA